MKLDLKYYGDPQLRKKCEPVEEIDDKIREFAQNLVETMLHFNGAGLAAPQVGVGIRMFVIQYDNGKDQKGQPFFCPPCVYINPQLSNPSKEQVSLEEGCLSVPGVFGHVSRPISIDVSYTDLDGNLKQERATEWRSRVIMHENDHLNGVLHVDRITLKQKRGVAHLLREIKKKQA